MNCTRKIEKLIGRLEAFLVNLHNEEMNLCVGRLIDDFYYKQKIEELTFLKCGLLSGSNKALYRITEIISADAFKRWKREVRLLNKLLLFKSNEQLTIL